MILDKSGQFYLIAAIILVTVIIGVTAISNFAKRETQTEFSALRDELQIESANVIDYGSYNGFGSAQINGLLQDFTQNYIDTGTGKNLYFIFGNKNNVTVKGYQELDRAVSIISGNTELLITSVKGEFIGSIDPETANVIVKIGDSNHEFEVKEGENFYFIISQVSGGGEFITKG